MKILLFIITLLTCNILSAQRPHGIYVSPKDYQPFFNYNTDGLVEALGDTSTLYLKRKKAFGEYVFDLQDSTVQFWAKGQLISESKIYHIAGQSYGYRSLVEPELDVDFNVKGTLNISLLKEITLLKLF